MYFDFIGSQDFIKYAHFYVKERVHIDLTTPVYKSNCLEARLLKWRRQIDVLSPLTDKNTKEISDIISLKIQRILKYFKEFLLSIVVQTTVFFL